MEPDLQDGDLIVAREEAEYSVGDTIIYEIFGGYVVHEIISDDNGIFRTQGANNPNPDSWAVPRGNVLGKQLVLIPGFGKNLVFLRTHPIALGLAAAVLAALLLIDLRPHRTSTRLREFLKSAKRELPKRKWRAGTWMADGLFLLAVTSLIATSIMLTNQVNFYPRVALTLLAAVLATAGFELLSHWMNTGQSLTEPYRSIRTFGEVLYSADEEHEIEGPSQLVDSSSQLRKLADTARSPIVHIVRQNGHLHEFWLITDDLNYFWRVHV